MNKRAPLCPTDFLCRALLVVRFPCSQAEAELRGSELPGVQRAATALAVAPDTDGPIPDTGEKGLGKPSATLTCELQQAPLTKTLVVPEREQPRPA